MLGWSSNLVWVPGRDSVLHFSAVHWLNMAYAARAPMYSKMSQVRRFLPYLAVCYSHRLGLLAYMYLVCLREPQQCIADHYELVDVTHLWFIALYGDLKSIMFVLTDVCLQKRVWMLTSRVVFMSGGKSYKVFAFPSHLGQSKRELYRPVYNETMYKSILCYM